MKLLLAVDSNFAIGKDGDMLFRIPEDQKRFRKLTTGNIIVMGRKTLDSFPSSKPLPNRENVVFSRSVTNKNFYDKFGKKLPKNLNFVKNRNELKILLARLNPFAEKEVFLIGGGILVRDMIDLVDSADLTLVEKTHDGADSFIPDISKDPSWRIISQSEKKEYEGLKYSFCQFVRVESV